MVRRIAAFTFILALPLAAAVQSVPAQAQYFSPPPGVYQEPLPPPGVQDQRYYPVQGQPGPPPRVLPYPEEENTPLPPPGFATPNGGPPPVYGHHVDQQQISPAASPSSPAAQNEPGAIRPPGSIGGAPGAAPQPVPPSATAALPPEDQPEQGQPKKLSPNLRRQLVDYPTKQPAGTIVVDTAHTYLYLVLGGGKAIRYGVRVGREGFTWTGTERISKMKEWPDWFPPPEMIERQPYLPRMMAGGPGNPLGARAMYLGHTLYRIHGTNQPSTIGHYVSSGCVGMLNEDVEDLYNRVQVGSRVVVLPGKAPETASNTVNPPSDEIPAPANVPPRSSGTAISGAALPPPR
jgi:lipoprotein-anchoring transpeptidase ErfK/SrfK